MEGIDVVGVVVVEGIDLIYVSTVVGTGEFVFVVGFVVIIVEGIDGVGVVVVGADVIIEVYFVGAVNLGVVVVLEGIDVVGVVVVVVDVVIVDDVDLGVVVVV